MAERIESLQVLRFVAALSIAARHLPGSPLNVLDPQGFGVDVFFVISGFIICLVADERRPAEFMWDRVARVVPLYWALTLAVAAVALVAPSLLNSTTADPWLVVQSLLFIPFMKASGEMQPILYVGWTLNYEMLFYGLFALCLFAGRAAPVLMLGVLALLASLGYLVQFEIAPLVFWTDGYILEFGLGIVLCLLWRRWRFAPPLVLLAPVGLALVLWQQTSQVPLPREVAYGVPAMLVVAGTLALRIERKGLWAPLVALGNASYALYLSHPYVVLGADAVTRRLGLDRGAAMIVTDVFALLAACLVALAIHYRFERPVQRWLLRIGPARARVAVA